MQRIRTVTRFRTWASLTSDASRARRGVRALDAAALLPLRALFAEPVLGRDQVEVAGPGRRNLRIRIARRGEPAGEARAERDLQVGQRVAVEVVGPDRLLGTPGQQ